MVTTFLPVEDFRRSAEILDPRRRRNQPRETLEIMSALLKPGFGYQYHPAVLMWRGHGETLLRYQVAFDDVLKSEASRAYLLKTERLIERFPDAVGHESPPWLGHEPLHRSHRLVLFNKVPETYFGVFGDLSEEIDGRMNTALYFWPRTSRKKRVIDHLTGEVIVENYGGGPFPSREKE